VSYLIEVPVEGGGRLLVEAAAEDLPQGLELASRPGDVALRASQSLEHAVDQVRPALKAVLDRMIALAPAEVEVEFGLRLGAETGVVVAKGTSEVHFTVTLVWRRDTGPPVPAS
jgi:hypothetical protein